MNRDLAFLSRRFETYEIPKEKAYLYKYFKTTIQEAFLKYFFVFNDYANFMEHTGHRCEQRWLKLLHERLISLQNIHAQAKKDMDFELLAVIESGKYKSGWTAKCDHESDE